MKNHMKIHVEESSSNDVPTDDSQNNLDAIIKQALGANPKILQIKLHRVDAKSCNTSSESQTASQPALSERDHNTVDPTSEINPPSMPSMQTEGNFYSGSQAGGYQTKGQGYY